MYYGGLDQSGCYPVQPTYTQPTYAYSGGYPAGGSGFGSGFALIVVLFILLIIVGACLCF